MKKVLILLSCVLLAAWTFLFCSCDTLSQLQDAVKYPDAYALSYEVTDAEGIITTLTKIVDADGNVYYKDAQGESAYLLEGNSYIKYQKNAEGVFVKASDGKLTGKAVQNETAGIDTYAKESQKQFMPTAKREADAERLGRTVHVFKVGVGSEATGSNYYYYVDAATGICLGVETKNAALGHTLPYNGESFACVMFETQNVQSVASIIEN